MTQYLSEVKTIVDNISAAGSKVDAEDIILYILNGLPSTYQSFKSAIRTRAEPISLDELYSLLISEEVNLATEAHRENPSPQFALNSSTQRGRSTSFRGRGRSTPRGGRAYPPPSNSRPYIQCQICQKPGHLASDCWHRTNLEVSPPKPNSRNALSAIGTDYNSNWILDSGATSHLTPNIHNIQHPLPYQGSDQITVGDGSTVPILHSGNGILPTPSGKLLLKNLYHVPNLSHNLLSISRLTNDNNCRISFDSRGFSIKDLSTNRPLLEGPHSNGLYSINTALSATSNSSSLWHQRLGHPHRDVVISISNQHISILLPNSTYSIFSLFKHTSFTSTVPYSHHQCLSPYPTNKPLSS